jgi:hypothetical protein
VAALCYNEKEPAFRQPLRGKVSVDWLVPAFRFQPQFRPNIVILSFKKAKLFFTTADFWRASWRRK